MIYAIVGANCSTFGCGLNRRHSGISIFFLPKGEDDLSTKNGDKWVQIITCNRQINKDYLQPQISAGNLHICEKILEIIVYNFFAFIKVMDIQV